MPRAKTPQAQTERRDDAGARALIALVPDKLRRYRGADWEDQADTPPEDWAFTAGTFRQICGHERHHEAGVAWAREHRACWSAVQRAVICADSCRPCDNDLHRPLVWDPASEAWVDQWPWRSRGRFDVEAQNWIKDNG